MRKIDQRIMEGFVRMFDKPLPCFQCGEEDHVLKAKIIGDKMIKLDCVHGCGSTLLIEVSSFLR